VTPLARRRGVGGSSQCGPRLSRLPAVSDGFGAARELRSLPRRRTPPPPACPPGERADVRQRRRRPRPLQAATLFPPGCGAAAILEWSTSTTRAGPARHQQRVTGRLRPIVAPLAALTPTATVPGRIVTAPDGRADRDRCRRVVNAAPGQRCTAQLPTPGTRIARTVRRPRWWCATSAAPRRPERLCQRPAAGAATAAKW
jgi:hypothetical protein